MKNNIKKLLTYSGNLSLFLILIKILSTKMMLLLNYLKELELNKIVTRKLKKVKKLKNILKNKYSKFKKYYPKLFQVKKMKAIEDTQIS